MPFKKTSKGTTIGVIEPKPQEPAPEVQSSDKDKIEEQNKKNER